MVTRMGIPYLKPCLSALSSTSRTAGNSAKSIGRYSPGPSVSSMSCRSASTVSCSPYLKFVQVQTRGKFRNTAAQLHMEYRWHISTSTVLHNEAKAIAHKPSKSPDASSANMRPLRSFTYSSSMSLNTGAWSTQSLLPRTSRLG